jgi:predicted nucleic acid-binding protein
VIDCSSFYLMRRESIRVALAFDDHFSQAGFEMVE